MGTLERSGYTLGGTLSGLTGYEGDIEKLWETAQKQNSEAASLKRFESLIDAQRRQVAHHAGEQWRPLLDYLSAKRPQLPEN